MRAKRVLADSRKCSAFGGWNRRSLQGIRDAADISSVRLRAHRRAILYQFISAARTEPVSVRRLGAAHAPSRSGGRFTPITLSDAQHALDLGGGSRTVEEIPLYFVAAFRAEDRELFVRLYAFRCARDAQTPCEPGDRANDGNGVVARSKLVQKEASILIVSNGKLRR
jgi:hypothetical protein